MAASMAAASATRRVIGPIWATVPKALAGKAGTRPKLGFNPVMPLKAEGTRIEPPPSVPRWKTPAPVAAASDDETVVSSWNLEEPAPAGTAAPAGDDFGDFGELNDDPIDTKLDLARAYLDMGDPDGARAMLDEVMQEGSQMQKDVARGLLDMLA